MTLPSEKWITLILSLWDIYTTVKAQILFKTVTQKLAFCLQTYVTLPSEKWTTLILFVTLRYLHHSKEHKFSLKWWHKNYQNQFTGLVIVTVWSFNHHSISFWGTCNVFIIQTLATSGCMFKTPFNDIYKNIIVHTVKRNNVVTFLSPKHYAPCTGDRVHER